MTDFGFEMRTDLSLIASEVPTERVIELVVTPPSSKAFKERSALNLALVIDRSGSMHGFKLDYAKQAAAHVAGLLQDRDLLAVVAFDDEVSLISPNMQMTSQAKASLISAIQDIHIGGSTNLGGGWLEGCKQVASVTQEAYLSRTLLLTDGQANVGMTSLEELGLHAGNLLERGVSTSTFGIGEGFNEHLLEHMANQGGGQYYYIESPEKIPEIFAQEFKDLSQITASAVEVFITYPVGVSVEVLGNWRSETSGQQLHLWLGDIPSESKREVYLKVLTPPKGGQDACVFEGKVLSRGEEGEYFEIQTTLSQKYAPQVEVIAAAPAEDILQRYNSVRMAEKATEALKLERTGERDKALRVIHDSLSVAERYLTPEENQRYQDLAKRMRRGPLAEAYRKTSHRDQYLSKQRRPDRFRE